MEKIKQFLEKEWIKPLFLIAIVLYIAIYAYDKFSSQKIQVEKLAHQIELDRQKKIDGFIKKCEEEFASMSNVVESGSVKAAVALQFFEDKYKSNDNSTVEGLLVNCAKEKYGLYYGN
ncbi:MAG: hypothetical protein AAB920_00840 [Patescibacteria group bacterium]